MVDDTKLQEEQLHRVSSHIRLDGKGRVHIVEPKRYRMRDTILLYLMGVRYAADAGLRERSTAELSELSENLGVASTSLASRLMELRKEGKVDSEARGEYQIVFARVPTILSEIESGAKIVQEQA